MKDTRSPVVLYAYGYLAQVLIDNATGVRTVLGYQQVPGVVQVPSGY